MIKKAVDRKSIDRKRFNHNDGKIEGVAGSTIVEPVPEYISTPSEKIFSNSNNAWIVLGRDRPANKMSGYGGRGDTQCASIDLVAGRLGSRVAQLDENGERIYVDPNIKSDAARIYISQKTDVDENFGIADGKIGNIKTRSAIALKADGIRIVARENIKLVTGTDLENSQGGDIRTIAGIDLMAGNKSDMLQPLVKGDNLIKALEKIVEQVDKLAGIVDTFLQAQIEYNSIIMAHTHITAVGPTAPSIETVAMGAKTILNQLIQTKMSLVSNKFNFAAIRFNYLSPAGIDYINSRWNNVN